MSYVAFQECDMAVAFGAILDVCSGRGEGAKQEADVEREVS